MEQPRDDVRGLARGGRGAPRLVGDVYGIGDWCGAHASARGRPVGPPSQNLPLTTFQDRRALLSPVPEWVPADSMHEVDCDANAQAVLSDSALAALTREGSDPATILARITATLGLDWQTPAAV